MLFGLIIANGMIIFFDAKPKNNHVFIWIYQNFSVTLHCQIKTRKEKCHGK